jgi:hypothetical protein
VTSRLLQGDKVETIPLFFFDHSGRFDHACGWLDERAK